MVRMPHKKSAHIWNFGGVVQSVHKIHEGMYIIKTIKVIFDTDMESDCDDAGAGVLILHNLIKQNYIELQENTLQVNLVVH